jgi:hypothetical protein
MTLGLVGCIDDTDNLTIATSWPAAERVKIEEVYRKLAIPHPSHVHWVLLAPGDDIARTVRRRPSLDLILGGPASAYALMAREGAIEGGGGERASWVEVHPTRGLRNPSVRSNDPRLDPLALSRYKTVLALGRTWSEVYGQLILSRLRLSKPEDELSSGPVEGAAVVHGALHRAAAGRLLDQLAVRGQVEIESQNIEADSILADLLGAALLEAGDELHEARKAIEESGHPTVPESWMTQPPPWPPASVAQILLRETNALPLLETLAVQVAPEADARSWLMRSWLAPQRSVDDRLIAEIVAVANGRLAREPRFRAWLRSEWRAWAAQRYRRVARLARAQGHVAKGRTS